MHYYDDDDDVQQIKHHKFVVVLVTLKFGAKIPLCNNYHIISIAITIMMPPQSALQRS